MCKPHKANHADKRTMQVKKADQDDRTIRWPEDLIWLDEEDPILTQQPPEVFTVTEDTRKFLRDEELPDGTFLDDKIDDILVIDDNPLPRRAKLSDLSSAEANQLRTELKRANARIKELEDLVDDNFGGK